MLQQGFGGSSAQNRGHGGDVRLKKSGELAAVPTAAAAAALKLSAGAPSEEDNLLHATKPKKVAMALFVERFPGLQKTTKKSAAEPRYMTFEAQNFLLILNKEDT